MAYSEKNEEVWRNCGKEACHIRARLFELRSDIEQKLLPKKDIYYLNKAIDYLDKFRCHAENEMPKHGGPDDNKIWYPGTIHPKK